MTRYNEIAPSPKKGIAMHFSLKKQTALLMAVLFVLPANVIAGPAQKANSKPILRNVELTREGAVHGRVLDIHGKAVADTVVQVSTKAGTHEAKTNKKGQFTVAGLKGGNCVVKVDEAAYGARLWKQGTAPPKSLKSFSVVNDPNFVVRGQDGMLFGLTPAQLLGLGLVAGGIVAIAIAADDDDGS